MGSWENGVWSWNFKWRRRLCGREVVWLEDLLGVVQQMQVVENVGDKWIWRHEGEGAYTVNSSYCFLQEHANVEGDPAFQLLWSVPAPSNPKALAWRVLWDRVQTRDNLRKRGVIGGGVASLCPLCEFEVETSSHLFFLCPATVQIWYACFGWLGISTALVPSSRLHIIQFPSIGRSKAQHEGEVVIWLAIIWSVWLYRNKVIFQGGIFEWEQVFEMAQLRAWQWLSARAADFSYSWYEWKLNPTSCLLSL
ncbi:uncharacterized protein LOC130743913 [Lotus japonicus]|uniref:uncharacterized protein LOC130743913 n=1 Tax=Lotus japonicus TaxID=34305 RepID=UPI002586C96F|nr:uncharacterized protein LOC130743913 [Lotus japonicus]